MVVTPLDAALAGGAAAQQGIAATAKLRAFLNDVAALASSLPPTLAPRIDQRRLERAMGVKWAAQLLHSVKQEKLAHVVALLPFVNNLRLSFFPECFALTLSFVQRSRVASHS